MPIRRALAALAVVLTGILTTAGACDGPPLEQRICLNVFEETRIVNADCEQLGAPADGTAVADLANTRLVRWAYADPACLDADDYTPVGAKADDDYLGEECDDDEDERTRIVVVQPGTTRPLPPALKASARPTVTASRAPQSKTTTSKPAARKADAKTTKASSPTR